MINSANKYGKITLISGFIGGVVFSSLINPNQIDKDTVFAVYEGDVQFIFRQSNYDSKRDAFLAARAWKNNAPHFEQFGGMVVEKTTHGFDVRPVYINGGF